MPGSYRQERRIIYIKLPEEDDEPGMCGLCHKALYGFLDAASCWSDEVSDMLNHNGLAVGKACPALFRHDVEELIGLVHGDDFLTLSDDRGQDFFEKCLKERYQYKMRRRIGGQDPRTHKVRVANRYIWWPVGGDPEYETDPRHAQFILKSLNPS